VSVFKLDVDGCFVETALTGSASAIYSPRRCIVGYLSRLRDPCGAT
jgi:hypothetical protein